MGTKCSVNAMGSALELTLDGVIGDKWADDPVTAAGVRRALASAPNAQEITVAINSIGGDFFEGLQIYQLLEQHPAKVTVRVGALAASAATLIVMAGDERIAHETSQWLVHDPWTIAAGNAADFRKLANDLDTLSGSLVLAYQARTSLGDEVIRALLAEDRFMGAAEALQLGFLTGVTTAKSTTEAPTASPEQARAAFSGMRAQARQRMAAMVAVAAPPQAHGAEETEDDMKNEAIIAALGLTEGAQDSDITGAIASLRASSSGAQKVLAALGAKTYDEALGVATALQGASERAVAAETKLAEVQAKVEQGERDAIVATLRAEGKVTPAQEKELLPALNLTALKAFAASAPKIAALGPSKHKQPGDHGAASKAFKDMTPAEQRELALSDPELFDQLSAQA